MSAFSCELILALDFFLLFFVFVFILYALDLFLSHSTTTTKIIKIPTIVQYLSNVLEIAVHLTLYLEINSKKNKAKIDEKDIKLKLSKTKNH